MYKVIVTKMPQTAPQTQMIDVDKQGQQFFFFNILEKEV